MPFSVLEEQLFYDKSGLIFRKINQLLLTTKGRPLKETPESILYVIYY